MYGCFELLHFSLSRFSLLEFQFVVYLLCFMGFDGGLDVELYVSWILREVGKMNCVF